QGFNFPQAAEMPQAYNLPEKADLWVPLARDSSYWQKRMQRGLVCLIGRLKQGVTATQAQAEMDSIAARQALAYPDTHKGWRVWLTPLFNQVVGRTRLPLFVLLGAVGILLLIACANITSLLLTKAAGRRREIAVRAAIGADRFRIIRQLMTESMLLGVLGGSFGLLLGYSALHTLLTFVPTNVPRLQNVALDSQVFLFTAFISLLTGALFGLAPAWQASKLNVTEALKSSTRNSAGKRINSHSFLVSIQIALVAVLLVSALLMVKSFRRLLAVDPGFRPQGVATFQISPSSARYSDEEQRRQFYEQVQSRLRSLPGVQAVGAVSLLPLSGNENMNYFAIDGAQLVSRGQEPLAEARVVTPGYFNAMGVSFVNGRDFDERDGNNKPLVAIVNETMVRKFFPDGNAVGKRIKWALDDEEWRTIVGVVRDVRGYSLEGEARPQFYYPFAEAPGEEAMSFVVRVDAPVLPAMHHAIRQELKQLDPTIPAANFRTMTELVTHAVARPRFSALLLALFAALAAVLAFVGLYGVIAHGVTQRTREIGIRIAVGARQTDVLAMMIRPGMRPAFTGLTLGLFAAFVFTRVLASQLYEVSPADPVTFVLVAVGLFVVAFTACFIPARRATQIDAARTLRSE
ncbi:MAG TPA: ABC transporter permease, partial [Pyrinomonadaceae bacterium]|nr:ABC transporter permease [Pyrinomonadaceae bacterium]